ncbi:N-acetylglucosamine-6-phosphate deacetylase [Kribbella sp. NPDC050124]|uniref:N-acetylglucosamine-6-phosphate deacetylase n=1 Tax=Kribbella sp. NPDC050124 TaxID=3364114 RepID=UPI00378DFEFB
MALTGRDPWTGQLLRVEQAGGRVTAVEFLSGDEEDLPWVSPGLVDLQVNGFGGFDVNGDELSVEVVVGLWEVLRGVGVTTFVPTLVTAGAERTRWAVGVLAEARRQYPEVAGAVPFVHLEGPHISAQDGPRGCHDVRFVRAPDFKEFEEVQRAAGGLVGMMTVSPHWVESVEFIAAVRATGTRVAIGHTHATTAQIRAAVDAGARLSTHLGNGAHAQLPRHPNYLWAQLADDRLSAGFIADGHHLPVETFVAMVRAKGVERSFLVSDSVAVGGQSPGCYETAVGGDVELTDDGRLLVRGTPYLAGAAAPLKDGVGWAAAAFSLPEALTMATTNPGRIVGGMTGQLRPGTPMSSVVTFRWKDGTLDFS